MVWNNFPEVGIGSWDLRDIGAWQATNVPGTVLNTGLFFNAPGLWCVHVSVATDNALQASGFILTLMDFNVLNTILTLGATDQWQGIIPVHGPVTGATPSRLQVVVGSGAAGAMMACTVLAKLLQRQG